jgi:glycosyltransferase involved in cell wall biosynthesis
LNILIITHGIAPDKIGGSETQTLGLAKELAKRNDVAVITRWKKDLPRIEERNRFVIKRLGKKPSWPFPVFSFTFESLLEIRKLKRDVDIILAKTIYFGFLCLFIKTIFRIPVVVLIEGEQEYRDERPVNQFMLRLVSKTSRMIVQTKEIQKELYQKVGVIAEVIPNGVYMGKEKASGKKVIYAGRLIRDSKNDKGVRYLIDAVKYLDCETLIIGDGPERKRLEKRAGGVKNIRFIGEVLPEKIILYLQQGYVLVLPSVYGEGLPNVILEAMSVGLPIIATRTAGITDVIQHGKTGFIVEPGDVTALRYFIDTLKKDKQLWLKMSQCCLQEVKAYDWMVITRRFEDMFKDTVRF